MTEKNKQIFLYKSAANLSEADLIALSEAGFIPIKVDDFDDVRIIDPLVIGDRSAIWMAAIGAISSHDPSKGPGAKTLFGTLLAEKLLDTDVPKIKKN